MKLSILISYKQTKAGQAWALLRQLLVSARTAMGGECEWVPKKTFSCLFNQKVWELLLAVLKSDSVIDMIH